MPCPCQAQPHELRLATTIRPCHSLHRTRWSSKVRNPSSQESLITLACLRRYELTTTLTSPITVRESDRASRPVRPSASNTNRSRNPVDDRPREGKENMSNKNVSDPPVLTKPTKPVSEALLNEKVSEPRIPDRLLLRVRTARGSSLVV